MFGQKIGFRAIPWLYKWKFNFMEARFPYAYWIFLNWPWKTMGEVVLWL
jgi:hypothetical protein